MIRLVGIVKSFGAVNALSGVSLTAAAGTVHGILGENGAGKSTLMRILFGLERADSGTIAIGPHARAARSPRDAVALGVGMVHQHFALVPTATVVDACILGAGHGSGRLNRQAWRQRIRTIADLLHWDINPDARIQDLGVGQQQRVEIIKALLTARQSSHAGTLILDEPTAVLTPQEVDELLPALRRLAADGTTVLFISHKLHEVERVCDDLTILRRGAVVHHGPAANVTRSQMAELMVGSNVTMPKVQPRVADATVVLQVEKLSVDPIPGARVRQLADVSFAVRRHEVVAIAGVDGNGQLPLIRCVLGLDPSSAVVTPGIAMDQRLAGRTRLGVIPDDRQHEALVMSLSIERNLVLKDHRRAPFSRFGCLNLRAWRSHARELITRFDVRGAGPAAAVSSLSGGNQQKVVIARELHRQPALIVAVNPTRGLDVAASASVMTSLIAARDGGAGVLLVHHDLDELLAVADRVLVLFNGVLTDSGWPQCDREQIGRLMLGGT